MPRIRVVLSYEGTRYSGWQRQNNTEYTVQGLFENALAKLVNSRVNVVSCGRTDAGVHARVQVVHADIPDTAVRLLAPGPPVAWASRA